jgi:hypothetical protein
MGFFKPTAFVTGMATEGLNMFNKAETIADEGLENMKVAREEVNEEIKSMKDSYNKAVQIGDNVGGGAFAKYLFNTQDISYLAGLANETQETRTDELSALKKNFESLSEEDKARFSDGDFSEFVQSKYDREVDAIKVNNGLVNTNNLGVATANTLGGKVQAMVDRQYEPRRQAIIDTVGGGQLEKSEPIMGGFEALSSATTGVLDWATAGGPDNLEIANLKAKIIGGFENYLESNRFKAPGTNLFTNAAALEAFGNVVGIEYGRQYPDGRMGRDIIGDKLEEAIMQLEGEGVATTKDAIMEDILKQDYINKNYGDVFKYSGIIDVLEGLVDEDE